MLPNMKELCMVLGVSLLVFVPYASYILLEKMQASIVFLSAKPNLGLVRMQSQPTPAISTAPSKSDQSMASKWAQKTVVLRPQKRGCHLVTPKILKEIEQDLSGFKCGLAHFFMQHTSASLTINENYDSDVRDDTETFLNRIVPEGRSAPWKHTIEGKTITSIALIDSIPGLVPLLDRTLINALVTLLAACPDDMPAHIKSSMFGCSLTVPITNGHLNMGTWQGIWLCEHRDYATPRKIVVTLNGV